MAVVILVVYSIAHHTHTKHIPRSAISISLYPLAVGTAEPSSDNDTKPATWTNTSLALAG